MKRSFVGATVLVLAGFSLTGCETTRDALGLNKVVPDEFRIVTKAPLVVPPDYALRPPSPGEPSPQELQPQSAARETLLGQRASTSRSDGEKFLTAKAGADRADPLARYVVDDEFGDLAYKDKSFADTVMFWKKPAKATVGVNASMADESTPIDSTQEAAAVKALTGGGTVIIKQRKESKLKLPGL